MKYRLYKKNGYAVIQKGSVFKHPNGAWNFMWREIKDPKELQLAKAMLEARK